MGLTLGRGAIRRSLRETAAQQREQRRQSIAERFASPARKQRHDGLQRKVAGGVTVV